MPNTFSEVATGGMTAVGQVKLLFIDYANGCNMQSDIAMCCQNGNNREAVTSKFIENAWVAAITVCAQHL